MGKITLEALLKFLPHALAVLLLVFILFKLYGMFTAKEISGSERDFNRIVAEMDSIIRTSGDISLKVPVSTKKADRVAFFQSSDPLLPKRCINKPCLCMYSTTDEGIEEFCHSFDLKDCEDTICSRKPCFGLSKVVVPVETFTITIKKECNIISIE